jgi:hypothetical protein
LLLYQPGEHLLDDDGLRFLDDKAARGALLSLHAAVAIGTFWGKEATSAYLVQLTTPTAFLEGRTLELSEEPLDFADQPVFGGSAERPVDKVDRTSRSL